MLKLVPKSHPTLALMFLAFFLPLRYTLSQPHRGYRNQSSRWQHILYAGPISFHTP